MVVTRSRTKKRDASMKIFHASQHLYKHQFRIGDTFSDVTVKIGKFRIRSHKRVLEEASPYYKCMFANPLKEAKTDVVVHKSVNEGTMKSLIEMAYSNQLRVDIGNVQDVLVAADYMCMDKLKLFCEDFMIEQIDESNVFGFLNFGSFCGFKYLISKADKYIAINFLASTSTNEFLSLEKNELISLLSRSDLEVKLEEEIFEACKRWINKKIKIRSKSMFELLQQVRLTLVKPEYLANVVATFPACKSSSDCQQLISNAVLYNTGRSRRIKYDVGEVKPRGFRSGKIYIISSATISSFDNHKHEKVADMNTTDRFRGVALMNGKMFLTGGQRFHGNPGSVTLSSVNEVYAFSPFDNNFKSIARMNYNRRGHGCCSHAGGVFACGGKDGEYSSCCEKLDIEDNKWTFIAEMTDARHIFQVVSCGNFLWAFGGWGTNGILKSTEYYNDVSDKWTRSTPMIEKRYGHSAVALHEKIYIIGGGNSNDYRLNTAEVFDTKTVQFSSIQSMQIPRYRFGAAIIEHQLYCFGGDDRNSVEFFDLYTREWKKKGHHREFRFVTAVTDYDE